MAGGAKPNRINKNLPKARRQSRQQLMKKLHLTSKEVIEKTNDVLVPVEQLVVEATAAHQQKLLLTDKPHSDILKKVKVASGITKAKMGKNGILVPPKPINKKKAKKLLRLKGLLENKNWKKSILEQVNDLDIVYFGSVDLRSISVPINCYLSALYKLPILCKLGQGWRAIWISRFGDSTFALPTEEGLKIDALAAYDWIVAQGVDPSRIIIVGHSLGSGVATDLAHTISVNKAKIGSPGCGGLVILSGYASIADASLGYPMVPVLKPFCGYPEYEKWVKSKMTDKWHSAKKMPFVSCPVLIIHGFKDFEIRPWQARALFLQAAQGRLEKPLLKEDEGFWELRQPRPFDAKEVAGISVTHLDGDEGTLWSLDHSMTPNSSTKTPNHVWFLEVKHAGHNTLSTHQVVKDTIDSWVEGI
ncbi:hypothetical protein HDV02_001796 [Globomyces sp. JEL0801]|nr:hypothetical protein HDV02_001796 [Globomyces sp. JEL0801]